MARGIDVTVLKLTFPEGLCLKTRMNTDDLGQDEISRACEKVLTLF